MPCCICCIESCFSLDDLDPIRGHAFGRTGRVGVDGRLTGVSFSIFSLLVGACPDGEEETQVHECLLYRYAFVPR